MLAPPELILSPMTLHNMRELSGQRLIAYCHTMPADNLGVVNRTGLVAFTKLPSRAPDWSVLQQIALICGGKENHLADAGIQISGRRIKQPISSNTFPAGLVMNITRPIRSR